jgi:DNA-binding Lrp family transcriptional regulator
VHVDLSLKDRSTVERFEAAVAEFEEVVECPRMFGLPDYLIRVAVSGPAEYEAFYMSKLAELPGFARVIAVHDEGGQARPERAGLGAQQRSRHARGGRTAWSSTDS